VLHAQDVPLLVSLDAAPAQWESLAKAAGWRFLAPWAGTQEKSVDTRIRSLDTQVTQARQAAGVDPGRIYLVAQGEAATALFYVVSRVPDLWTAAVALGGTPRPAIDTNRLYAGNSGAVPVLWLFGTPQDEPLAKRLKDAGFNLEWKVEPAATAQQVLGWLTQHQRDRFPARIDCETGAPSFARCYWIQMTRFDPAERNDALDSTRVKPIGSGATLDLGGFGFDTKAPGPGIVITWLPPDYRGPLKLNDRLVAIGGKPVKDPADYVHTMDETTEARSVAVTVERGKERVRVETRILVPQRQETVTARVQAQYTVEAHEILILSRAVTEMRVTVPAEWAPVALNWNGIEVGKAEAAGCWLLKVEKGLLKGAPCP